MTGLGGGMVAITDADQSTYRGRRSGHWVPIDGMLAPKPAAWRDDKRGPGASAATDGLREA